MRVLRFLPFVLATALAVAIGNQAVAGSATVAVAPSAQEVGDTVTLLTGDRVKVGGSASRSVRVEPAPGREKMRFAVESTGGHVYVVPADAFRVIEPFSSCVAVCFDAV